MRVTIVEKVKVSHGDVIVIKNRGMSTSESYLVCEIHDEFMGVSFDGNGYLLGGIYHTLESLMEDLYNEPLIEKIMVYSQSEYFFSMEKYLG